MCSLGFLVLCYFALSGGLPLDKRYISPDPVIDANFPDPVWIENDCKFYAFSTNNAGHHVPMATSSDFKLWSIVRDYDALPMVGEWSTGVNVWAPDVVKLVR